MEIDYKKIESLEDIAKDAVDDIVDGSSIFNKCLAYEFNVELVNDSELSDLTDDAKKWADEICPESLHFNHGSFLKGGMDHLISELKAKPSSNRALLSLISQEHVSNSGDKPIPSFMILQTSIDDGVLYCTTYFRALEVKTFLRINIEEIRQRLCKISKSLDFSTIRLVIFSFRAYHNSSMIPLKKPEFDLLSPIKIFKKLDSTPNEFGSLIREKAKDSTVVYLDGLLSLKEAVEEGAGKLCNVALILQHIKSSIESGEKLKDVRLRHSHHASIKKIADDFSNSLKVLAKELDKCH